MAGWGEDGALEAIRDYAATIDAVARRLEDAVERRDETSHGEGAFAVGAA